jgi:hypothetical protein
VAIYAAFNSNGVVVSDVDPDQRENWPPPRQF